MSRPVSREQLTEAMGIVDEELRKTGDERVLTAWGLLRVEFRRARSQSQQVMAVGNTALQSAALASDFARQSAAASDRVLAELSSSLIPKDDAKNEEKP